MSSFFRRLLIAAARLLPDGLLIRLLPRALRWGRSDERVAIGDSSETSLYIGPANSAGQGYLWAEAVRKRVPGASAVSLMTIPRGLREAAFRVDVAVPLSVSLLSRSWRTRQRERLRRGFTHVLIESGRSPYGDTTERGVIAAVRDLEEWGLRTAFLWHGSDIRLPSEHAADEPDSPFGPEGRYPTVSTETLERNAREHRRMIERTTIPVFVSTPGLLSVDRATWLPVVVDTERWRVPGDPLSRDVPVVAYAPSNAALKGDSSVDAQLRELDEAGVISYRRVTNVPSEQMSKVYRTADIVLDQFRLGDYGVAACEAMAAGRVVIGHVSDDVRERVRLQTGHELPIWESRLSDVGKNVEAVLADRLAAGNLARRGVEFVARVHDGTASARILADFLGSRIDTGHE